MTLSFGLYNFYRRRCTSANSAWTLVNAQIAIAGHPEPSWWRGHSPGAVAIIVLIVFISVAPFFAGYLLEPPGFHFTGAPTYAEDIAQHESWAAQMAAHFGYHNLLTPEPTPRGWFFSPLEFFFGVVHNATGISYMVLANLVWLMCAPVLAFGLMAIARRAGLGSPGTAATIALLCGSLVPLVHGALALGLVKADLATLRSVGGDATPIFAGPSLYLLLAVLVLLGLPLGSGREPNRGFRLAGAPLFALAAVYPFFVPTLWLTAGFCALLWSKHWGWGPMLKGILWLALFSTPMLYWAALPRLDSEFGRFAAGNWRPLFSPGVTLVSLGLSSGAIIGIPRLLRGKAYQQMLACCAAAVIITLYIPNHPWRSHILYLSPVLVIGAIAAWWPVLLPLRPSVRRILAGGFVFAAMLSAPYYYARNVSALARFERPAYLTSGDLAAIEWIANQSGTDVVLARPDVSPWIAARAHHRVVVGNYLWTHQYQSRREQVTAIFDAGADPRLLLQTEQVKWIVLDEDRGRPIWAHGVQPLARFNQTVILSADLVIKHLDYYGTRRSPE